MNDIDPWERSNLPSAQPSRPAHLSGEALQQWYLEHPPLTEADRQRAEKVARDKQEATAWVWLMGVGMLVTLCHAVGPFSPPAFVLGPITASVLGVWLAMGRTNLLVRSLIALLVVVSFGWAFTAYRSFLMINTLYATTLSYALLWFFTWIFRTGTRRLRFTLVDIGGAILLVGCGLGVIQADLSLRFTDWEWQRFQAELLQALFISGNTVLVSMPVMVPRQDRSGKLLIISAALVLGVMPIAEFLCFWFYSPQNTSLLMIPVLSLLHLVGGSVVWSLVLPLEVVGAFREEKDPPKAVTEAAAGAWEGLE